MLLFLLATLLSFIYLSNASSDVDFLPHHCSIPPRPSFLNYSQLVQEPPVEICSDHDAVPFSQLKSKPKPKPKPKPWSREPECLTGKGTDEKYCVYLKESFARGRGVAFFTSPTIAERLTQLPAFTSPGLHDQANKFDNPPWEVRNIPGRGNGLFATRTLHRGDLILSNTPLGVYQSDAFFPDYEQGYKHLRKTFDQLPKSSQDIFLRMATHSAGDLVMERINTNAFAGEFEGAPHFFLYPETALMNHDCRPNAMYYHDPSTLIHASHASRTIHPGEEITITYINLLQPTAQRQQTLSTIWGFTCTCALCSSPNSHLSDSHIARIIELQTSLSSLSTATPKHAEELLNLYKKETLHAALGTGHVFAAQAYNAAGNAKKAVWHAKKAVEAGIVASEDPKGETASMENLIKDPRAHWTWKKK